MNPGSPQRPFSNIINCPPAPKLGYIQFFDHSKKEWKLVKKESPPTQENNFPNFKLN